MSESFAREREREEKVHAMEMLVMKYFFFFRLYRANKRKERTLLRRSTQLRLYFEVNYACATRIFDESLFIGEDNVSFH